MASDHTDEATIMKAFCDEKRLRIMALLRGGEKCVCALFEEMSLPQSTLSYHMKILCDAGVVEGRQEGKWTHYSISAQGVRRASNILTGYVPNQSARDKGVACCVPVSGKRGSHSGRPDIESEENIKCRL